MQLVQRREDEKSLSELMDHYHELTKHHFKGYAPGPETLDWDDQPDPFRQYPGSKTIDLKVFNRGDHKPYFFTELMNGQLSPEMLTLDNLSFFLQFCAGLTAWKTYGPDSWSLRAVPSSGNLHPGELYLLLPHTMFCDAGIYHYNVYTHQLELRRKLDILNTFDVHIIQTSVIQRELWKYGERALRYCWLDAGHQLSQCHAVAGMLGWRLSPVTMSKLQLRSLCGLPDSGLKGPGKEYPEWIYRVSRADTQLDDEDSIFPLVFSGEWQGTANNLGSEFVINWPNAQETAEANELTTTPSLKCTGNNKPTGTDTSQTAADIILSRRSGQAYDGTATYNRADFEQLISTLKPGTTQLIPESTAVHILCFVHSVEGLEPGIYLIPRSDSGATLIQNRIQRWQPWTEISLEGVPTSWLMKSSNTRKAVGQLSCNQAIAANSCFTLFFLGEYASLNYAFDQGTYSDLYLEAGMLGQQLYLQTTAQGYSGTGIGCFFDDAIHELLGLEDKSLQVLYGFAVGDAIKDRRITQLSGYYHLKRGE